MKSMHKFFTIIAIALFCCPIQQAFSQSSTFNYTGAVQTYTVGIGVSSVSVEARGAQGGSPTYGGGTGGLGGRTVATLAVTAGEVLYVYVGQQGSAGSYYYSAAPGGSSSGGGEDGGAGSSGSGGGAASDVRTISGASLAALSSRRVVGAGGGGGGYGSFCGSVNGGAGGGATGGDGTDCGSYDPVAEGGPGTATAPGAAGMYIGSYSSYSGSPGGFGYGGAAYSFYFGEGGGGGGGWYGAGGAYAGGGCGGSSHAGTGTSAATLTSGFQSGNGLVIINPLCVTPVAGTITGPGNVCAGSTISLTDATGTAGGVWTSSAGGIATVGSSSGVVRGVSAGTTTINYTITLSCGTAVATAVVTVNPLPGAISGSLNVCVGSTVGLTDATTGGLWTSSAIPIATVVSTSGVVYGVSAGTSTIFYTFPTGCNNSVVMSVNLAPTPITGPSSVCMGSTVIEHDASSGGNWSSSNTAVATIGTGSGLVTPESPGSTVITYMNGCGAAVTATVVVNPLPSPITGLTSLCTAVTIPLSDATPGGTWVSANSTIATVGSSSGLVGGLSGGVATISYVLPTSCAASGTVTVIPPLTPITGPHTVCVGLTAALGGLPLGGVWASSAPAYATIGSASGIVTGVSMGATLITYTTGVGCSATLEMTVNPRAPILGTDSVCVGTSGFLTNIVGGGVWSSSNPTIATTRSDSGRVTGIIPGTVTITYLLPTGCQSSVSYQVISFPGSISGITKACIGTTTALVNTTPTGGLWSSKNNSVATVVPATGVVTGVSADTVTVNYTILPGCAVGTLVTINPLPALIAGPLYVCPYTIDSLKDVTPGGLWSSGSVSLATVVDTSGVVTTLAGGDPVISYTLPTGCYRTKTLSIFAPPAPIVGYNPYTNTLYVTNTSIAYVSYQWYDSLVGEIPGATSPTLAGRFNEYYYVVVTDTNGCKGASVFYHYNTAETFVKNIVGNDLIKIYPNPASNTLFVESQIKVRAVVSGIDGRLLIEQTAAKEIDISKLADAMYFITFYDDDNNVVSIQKFVKG